MPINLCRHVKVWIHPDGLIPYKILNRLIFQRKVRPKDSLSLFVNQACIDGARDELIQLLEQGVKIKIVEISLSKAIDDKFLISFAQQILARVEKTKELSDSVYATNVLRLMKIIQQEGLYSNNDVLFLNFNNEGILRKQYLFGARAQGISDIHIFGIDLNYSDSFYKELVQKIKDMCGDPPYQDKNITFLPGLTFIPDSINISAYGHLNFAETSGNIITGTDCSHSDGKRKLFAIDKEDAVLNAAEDALQRGYVLASEFHVASLK